MLFETVGEAKRHLITCYLLAVLNLACLLVNPLLLSLSASSVCASLANGIAFVAMASLLPDAHERLRIARENGFGR